jgi:hypothetical protein
VGAYIRGLQALANDVSALPPMASSVSRSRSAQRASRSVVSRLGGMRTRDAYGKGQSGGTQRGLAIHPGAAFRDPPLCTNDIGRPPLRSCAAGCVGIFALLSCRRVFGRTAICKQADLSSLHPPDERPDSARLKSDCAIVHGGTWTLAVLHDRRANEDSKGPQTPSSLGMWSRMNTAASKVRCRCGAWLCCVEEGSASRNLPAPSPRLVVVGPNSTYNCECVGGVFTTSLQ